ncbi:CIC11C00000003086 [Sungouiella intermedia]|uniref:CIC11C00000003086 n=1 Tax=Sungouiella intermedia TaxID=45354 RepID=A0A1L0BA70_9ASCO|nr:CIC11C00000003086 [[Candida] intermedia]
MPPKKEKKPAFDAKSMVLAKMTGFPAWPLFVMPPDMIPSAIMAAKKKTTNLCVIFIPDGDFNWMNEKLLEVLSPDKLQAKLSKFPKDKLKAKPKKKSGRTTNVAEALLAATNLDFDDFMEELARQNKGFAQQNDEDDDEDEEEDEVEDPQDEVDNDEDAPSAANPIDDNDEEQIHESNESNVSNESHESNESHGSPSSIHDGGIDNAMQTDIAKRGRRKDAIAHSTLDEEEIEEEDELENGEDQDDSDSGVRKRTRNSRTTNGTRKRISPGTGNGKAKNGDSQKADARSSSPKPLTEKDRQHQLWLCRIKLQRSLIQRNQPATPRDPKQFPPPTVDELLVARIILHRLADFPVSVDLLRETKIHKVLKCILKDEDLEYPDSFRLHEKCEELLEKWKGMVESLKQEKQARFESRLSSQVPEDSEISGIETKRTLEGDHAEKLKV